MSYDVKFSEKSKKQLLKLDTYTRRMLINWVEKNLQGIKDPRAYGKSLKGNLNGYWRYRVGDYRIITKIVDKQLIILVIAVGHRKEIYEQ